MNMMMHCKKPSLAVALLSVLVCSNACAGSSGMALGGKHNNKAPIEVTSDSLEVMQEQNKAAFTGHVVAIQGTVRLTADKMTVFYASAEEKKANKKKEAPKKPEKGDKSNAQGAIKKIEAEGSVFLATPEETASGANGVYDVEHQEIHLNGNVALTRGKNILKGDKLTYNFATGRSVINGGGGDAPAGGKGKERVRALFVPESNKSNDKSDQ